MRCRELYDEAANGARILLVGAHPDDIVLAASSILAQATDVYCAIVTSGARRDDPSSLALVRRAEEIQAMSVFGIGADRLHFLDIFDQDCHNKLDTLISGLISLMRELRTDLVITHDYEQGHPDHDASAFCVAMAADRCGIACYVYPLYHRINGEVKFCSFREETADTITHRLSEGDLALKSRALSAYRSQQGVIKDFPLASESFRSLRTVDWRKTEETVYQRIPSISIDPAEVSDAIERWVRAHLT
jgi:LmbE family N-acetylglucosaminyl deacetylase